ncbi:hypothetical protein BJV74DRAFT_785912, partial [Russula compacta]
GGVTLRPILAHQAREGPASVAYICLAHGHVNYNGIPGVVYKQSKTVWVFKTEQDLQGCMQYKGSHFHFLPHPHAEMKLETESQVYAPVHCSIIGRSWHVCVLSPNVGEIIAEGVLALQYGASSKDIARAV